MNRIRVAKNAGVATFALHFPISQHPADGVTVHETFLQGPSAAVCIEVGVFSVRLRVGKGDKF